MIDTKEVWRKINSTDPMDHIDLHATIMTLLPSLLNRLEAAESDALEQARLNGMGGEREAALMAKLEAAEKERDALRAALRHEADCVEAAKAEIAALRAKLDELRDRLEAMEQPGPIAYQRDLPQVNSPGEPIGYINWQAGKVPDGWPTEEMTTAFARVFNSHDQYGTFPQAFRAALAVAPEAKL